MDIKLRADRDLHNGVSGLILLFVAWVLMLIASTFVVIYNGWIGGIPLILCLIVVLKIIHYFIVVNVENKKYMVKVTKLKKSETVISGKVVSFKYIRHDQENNLYRLFFDPMPKYLIGEEIEAKDIRDGYHIDTIFTVKGSDGKLYESPRYCDKLGNIGACTIYINPNNENDYYVAFEIKED